MAHFKTKYGIGTVLYAPRCYKRFEEKEKQLDDKQVSLVRRIFYEGIVKKKTVTRIIATIDINGEVTATYEVDQDGWAGRPESYLDKMHPRLDCAITIAEDHERSKHEFFG